VAFDSIAAGASETVTLIVGSLLFPIANVQVTPLVSSSTSDLNQSNNSTTALVPVNFVPIYIHSYLSGGTSDLGLRYSLSGDATEPVSVSGLPSYPSFAAPNSQVQIFWPSPQMTNLGGYPATFQKWSDGDTSNPRTFVATQPSLTVSAIFQLFSTPYLSASGVTNAGSYAANGVSPGEIVTLFGFNLGAPASGQIQDGALTANIGNTTILFDGTPAPLVYIGGTQDSVVVPYEVADKTSTTITVKIGGDSASVQVPVVAAAPALFTANASGTGQAAALNQDGTANSPLNPANPGDIVVLFGTGEGLVEPVPRDGAISAVPTPIPVLPITVTIGNQMAEVTYAAEAPSLTAGVIQMNVRIPAGISDNQQVPVRWSAGTHSSQQGTTIAVK
jgi:uncharacterized protein (TIGR03437 family)